MVQRRGRPRRCRSARMPTAPGELAGDRGGAGVSCPATAAPAPRKSAPASVTVISGWSENASWGAISSSEPAPEQWPTSGPGRMAAAAAGISSIRHAEEDDPGAGAVRAPAERTLDVDSRGRRAAARAVPSRPGPTMAKGLHGGVSEGDSRSSSRIEIPVGGGVERLGVRSVPRRVTATDQFTPQDAKRHTAEVRNRQEPGIPSPAMAMSASQRRDELKAVWERGRDCRACQLHETRMTVVFGAGNADADLMFVGEAPGATEDRLGLPFVGPGGQAARPAAGGDRARAQRGVHHQHPDVPAAGQP